MKKYKILASQKEFINSPTVWIQDNEFTIRNLAKVETEEGKSVWVDIQIIDSNFRKNYNNNPNTYNIQEDDFIIISNNWYRYILNLKKNESYNLKVTQAKSWILIPLRQMQAALKHPDNSIKICADLSIVSVFLGLIGLFLGIISLIK